MRTRGYRRTVMTPRALAQELGISSSTVRSWLRDAYPRPPGERGPWVLSDEQVAAARTRWGRLAAERRVREAEVAREAIAALQARAPAAPAAPVPARPTGPPAPAAVAAAPHPESTRDALLDAVGRAPHRARPPRPVLEPPPRRRPADTPERRQAVSRGWQIEASVFALALILGGLLPLGLVTSVSPAWIGAGASMVAFGIALDAYARALGGYVAHRAGERGWMWGCVLGGAPVVLVHAVVRRAGEPAVFEAAPLVALGALVLVFTLLGAAAAGQGTGT